MFITWYLWRYCGRTPFSHSALDIKTYAMALLRCEYRESSKRNMPRRWFAALPHTHVALDDAIEQGHLFCNMLKENLQALEKGPLSEDEMTWMREFGKRVYGKGLVNQK